MAEANSSNITPTPPVPLDESSSQSTSNFEDDDDGLICPICQDILSEAFMTYCGHSYCFACITAHLDRQLDCPICRTTLTRSQILPNFQLNRAAELRIKKNRGISPSSSTDNTQRYFDKLPYHELVSMLSNAVAKQKRVELLKENVTTYLMQYFLKEMEDSHAKLIHSLKEQLAVIQEDLTHVDKSLEHIDQSTPDNALESGDLDDDSVPAAATPSTSTMTDQDQHVENNDLSPVHDIIAHEKKGHPAASPGTSSPCTDDTASPVIAPSTKKRKAAVLDSDSDESTAQEPKTTTLLDKTLAPLKRRVQDRMKDLKELYWAGRVQESGIDGFASTLFQLSRYSRFEDLDTIYYTDIATNNAIVSSIEFDRDEEYMAVGGVSRDIKLFEFGQMNNRSSLEYSQRTRNLSMIHCPLKVIQTDHKISCLSWNPYIKSSIASSDYEGIVNLWDASTGKNVRVYDEHKRRAWSIDTCPGNPTLLASGSDDSTVKIWSINSGQSVHTLEQRGNVCCAKFAPHNNYHIAIGSADHHVTCYDLRQPKEPFETFGGHDKAVSYVKWIGPDEIISASTDSSLKLWKLNQPSCLRTYTGHLNEKNFVGLSLNQDWIACGSETNTLYAYHKNSRHPVAQYKFPTTNPLTGEETFNEDTTLFVSSVCWKQDSMKIAVANSKGMIKILQLVE
ncbi:WD40 repeat-like protein [Hesseltinella vesiculosa]|uniref:WD40 repeat-like protein n=1 Tax=Hesseltinella vesiculosa TaxID=101127 RepID=A0A1X2GHA6_9FUNG|nr:WD40 repeat-like protein [Hesseltinella vesiculosa]